MNDPVKESGLFVSLRRLLATVLEMAQVRLALLSTEVEIEKQRLFEGLLWAALALLAMGVGLILLCGFVILLFSEGYRLAALGTMSLLFLFGGVLLIREARRHFCNSKGLFNASLAELDRDIAGLQASSQYEQR